MRAQKTRHCKRLRQQAGGIWMPKPVPLRTERAATQHTTHPFQGRQMALHCSQGIQPCLFSAHPKIQVFTEDRAQCQKNHNFAASCGIGRTCAPRCRTLRLNFWNPSKEHCFGVRAMSGDAKVTKCCFLKTAALTSEKRALFPLGAVLTLKSVINLGTCAFNF